MWAAERNAVPRQVRGGARTGVARSAARAEPRRCPQPAKGESRDERDAKRWHEEDAAVTRTRRSNAAAPVSGPHAAASPVAKRRARPHHRESLIGTIGSITGITLIAVTVVCTNGIGIPANTVTTRWTLASSTSRRRTALQRIDETLGRPVEFFLGLKGEEKRKRVHELLEMVELPYEFAGRYPEELSGGQKQRVSLARALAADPEVLLCDEVTSALDSIVGANVIQLLRNLKDRTGVSFVFISHDLSTVSSFADEIVVLYAGRVVEKGPVDEVLSPPFHPYTRLLISSVPELRVGWMEEMMATSTAQAGIDRVVTITEVGCPFFDRCPLAIEGTCDTETAPNRPISEKHVIECHREVRELVEWSRS